MDIQALERIFRYNGIALPDPDPAMTPDAVRETLAATYPELTNAVIEGPEITGETVIYTFKRPVGTKG